MSYLDRGSFWISVIFSAYLAVIFLNAFPEIWSSPFSLVEDDARHFVIFLRQLINPELFPVDPIAAYFRSLTPDLYEMLFLPARWFGIDVVTWLLFFMMPLTGLLIVISSYRFFLLIIPDRVKAGWVTILFCLLAIEAPFLGLPRSFQLPILFLSLTAFLEGKRWLVGLTMLLGAAIYPAAAVIAGFTMAFFVVLNYGTLYVE